MSKHLLYTKLYLLKKRLLKNYKNICLLRLFFIDKLQFDRTSPLFWTDSVYVYSICYDFLTRQSAPPWAMQSMCEAAFEFGLEMFRALMQK